MKKLIALSMVLLFTINYINGQESPKDKNKLRIKSITVGFGIYSSDLRTIDGPFGFNQAGPTLSAGLSVAYKKHLFSLDIDLGIDIEINIFSGDDGENAYFNSYDILYGREFSIFKWLRVEAHTGLGMYVYKDRNPTDGDYDTEVVVGIPFDIRLIIDSSRGFSFGINPELNFNKINTTYIGNIVFQYRFN